MKARFLAFLTATATGGLLAALPVVTAAAAPPVGSQPAPSLRFTHLDGVAGQARLRLSTLDRHVKVIFELAGDPVGARQAVARAFGRGVAAAEVGAQLARRQQGIEGAIRAAGGRVLASYQYALNGVAADVPAAALPGLAARRDVVDVHPVGTYRHANVAGVQYMRANQAWADLGKTGRGVKIAIIDTGVDYYNADFGGSGDPADFARDDHTRIEPGTFPTAKVVGGYDFVGDDYDAAATDPAKRRPRPDPDPLDCNGHGTHVAGTAAGVGITADGKAYRGPYDATTYGRAFRVGPGVAPQASILAYRVFGCEGSVSDDIVVTAMDRALRDGANVVNLSLGSAYGTVDQASVRAADVLSRAGVVVVAAAGNDGPDPYVTGGPAVADRSIAAAAVDASGASLPAATLTLRGGVTIAAQNSNGAALPGRALPIAVIRDSYPNGPVSLGCSVTAFRSYPGGVAGKLAVVKRGACARAARAVYGQQAGAAAVAMINSDSGYPPIEGLITKNPDTGQPYRVTIPFLGVRGVLGPAPTADGDALVASDKVTTTLRATGVTNPAYRRLATFTSGGPRNGDSVQKPDVTAPGVSVVSASSGSGAEPATLSGTSMASPMTAGVAALVVQSHPDWSAELVKGAIVGTANPTATKILDHDVRLAGAGVVDAREAVAATVVPTTQRGRANLSFGYVGLAGPRLARLPVTLWNTGDAAVSYDLSAAFEGATLGATVTVSPATVTVPAHSRRDAAVTLAFDAGDVARLPAAGASNFGVLTTVRGLVVARPRTTVAGAYPLRVPFLVAPRGLSDVVAGLAASSGTTLTVPVHNRGRHAGTADVFAFGVSDPDEPRIQQATDIRAIGVASLPATVLDPRAGSAERAVVFAVNTYGNWSSPGADELQIAIDVNGDTKPDFLVIGADLGLATTGTPDGRFASVVAKPDGTIVNAWVAQAPMNTSLALLPTLAGDIGLKPGASRFRYTVTASSVVEDHTDQVDRTGSGIWDVFAPPVSTGLHAALPPGATAAFRLSVDPARLAVVPVRGWLIVSADDAGGASDADAVGLVHQPAA